MNVSHGKTARAVRETIMRSRKGLALFVFEKSGKRKPDIWLLLVTGPALWKAAFVARRSPLFDHLCEDKVGLCKRNNVLITLLNKNEAGL